MIPDINDLSKKRTLTGREVLCGAEIQGNKVAIIGGGQVGCEVGEFISEQGKEVTIIEILDDIARDMPHVSKLPLVMALENNGVRIMTRTKVQSVTEEGILVAYKGNEEVLQADLIVLATGTEPSEQDMDRVIKEKVPECYTIGDRVEGRGILEAIRAGYDGARNI